MRAADERVLVALAEPTRRQLLEALGKREASSATTLARAAPVSRQAVLKHLGVLQQAGLVRASRQGREVLYRVRPEPLVSAAAWLTGVAEAWDTRLTDLKHRAENPD